MPPALYGGPLIYGGNTLYGGNEAPAGPVTSTPPTTVPWYAIPGPVSTFDALPDIESVYAAHLAASSQYT